MNCIKSASAKEMSHTVLQQISSCLYSALWCLSMHMEFDYTDWKAHVSCRNMSELKNNQTKKNKTKLCNALTASRVRWKEHCSHKASCQFRNWLWRVLVDTQQPSQSFVISPNLMIFKLLSSSLK